MLVILRHEITSLKVNFKEGLYSWTLVLTNIYFFKVTVDNIKGNIWIYLHYCNSEVYIAQQHVCFLFVLETVLSVSLQAAVKFEPMSNPIIASNEKLTIN